ERGGEVTQEDVRRRAREGVRKTPRPAWPARACSSSLDQLLDHFADRQQRPADVAVRTDEEPVEDVAAPDLLCRIVERRGGEEASRRIAREQIADRRATVRQQTGAVRDPTHDLARIFGVVRHHKALRLLVPPAKPGYPVVVAVENAGLARRGLRRQERLPPIEGHAARAEPPREVGSASGAQLFFQDWMRESIDLDKDDARLLCDVALAMPRGELADERTEERI